MKLHYKYYDCHMSKQDILNLDGSVINQEQFEELKNSEFVKKIQKFGTSVVLHGKTMYYITLNDYTSIIIYFNKNGGKLK